MKKFLIIPAALALTLGVVGCSKQPTTPEAPTTGGVDGTVSTVPDFSSDATIVATVVPAVAAAVSKAVGAEGAVTVDEMNNVINIKGTVPNNDLKRAAEAAAKDALAKMNAPADIKVNNALMVK
jgi:hypothetical protein